MGYRLSHAATLNSAWASAVRPAPCPAARVGERAVSLLDKDCVVSGQRGVLHRVWIAAKSIELRSDRERGGQVGRALADAF